MQVLSGELVLDVVALQMPIKNKLLYGQHRTFSLVVTYMFTIIKNNY